MHHRGLTELEVILAVARRHSFRAAARELGMSATAVSNAVAGLEERLAVRLFHRSTRSVALTEVGQRYVARIAPAVAEIRQASDEIGSQENAPTGTLRINAPPEFAALCFDPLLRDYAQRYPGMRLDVVTEARKIDIVAEGFDAGVRLAEDVPLDMIAVPLTSDVRMLLVASPGYLAQYGVPRAPAELAQHRGVLMQLSNGNVYQWELEKDGVRTLASIPPRLVFSEQRAIHQAALAGLGLACIAEWFVAEDLAQGRLVSVMQDWCQPFGGLCLYYSRRRHVPAGLQALITLIRSLPLLGSPSAAAGSATR